MKIGQYEVTKRSIILLVSACIVVFNLYNLAWFPPSPFQTRGIFISVFILLAALLRPPKSKGGKISQTIFVTMALIGAIYPMVVEERLTAQFFRAEEMIDVYFFIIFYIGFIGLFARLAGEGGFFILGLVLAGIFYLFLGHHIPGYFGHDSFPIRYIATILYTDLDQGVFGMYTELNCRLISIFMIFAAFLVAAGLGDVFTTLATRIAGHATGGPAKVSIFSSAFFGMLSGSPVANVSADGPYTIPMMKNVGYSPSMAASIEALTSTGGNLMPPVMGIGAFLMAEILNIPYLSICVAALVPVFLWYFTLFVMIHYYALRNGIRKWRPDREEFLRVMKAKGHLLLAIVGLVGGLAMFAAAEQGAFWAVIFLVILATLKKETRLNKEKMANFLEQYASMFAPLFLFVIGIGILITCLTGSGVHTKLGAVIFGGIENWFVLVLLSALLVILLGLAIPIAAAYLAAISIVAPLLAPIEPNLLVVHFFIFYIATLAPITPPDCMASYTAARIAGADMWRTGWLATLKGLVLWIFPFTIFRDRLLIGAGTPWIDLIKGVAILAFGTYIFILGTEGYFKRNLNWPERVLAIGTGIMIVQPVSHFYSYIFTGVGILSIAYLWISDLVGRRVKKDQVI